MAGPPPTAGAASRKSATYVEPITGESVESLLVRRAHRTNSVLADLFNFFGLEEVTHRELGRLGTAQPAELGEIVAQRLEIDHALFWDMSLRRYEGRGIDFTIDGNVVLRRHWALATGMRYCVECLEETGGAFQLSWRLSWTFVCLRHRTILRDACPRCGERLKVPRGRLHRLIDPLRCQTKEDVEENATGLCSFRLLRTWREEPLPLGSPILAAQRFIDDILGRDGMTSVLDDLRAIMIAASHANFSTEVATASGEKPGALVGLGEKKMHVGSDPPDEALTMASLAAFAVRVLSQDDLATRSLLRTIVFSYRDGSPPEFNSRSQGSALEIISRFPGASTTLRRRIPHSVDQDLTVLHRLVHQTPLTPDRHLTPRQRAASPAADDLPPLMWPNWTQPLDAGGDYTEIALREGLIAGVRFVIKNTAVEYATRDSKRGVRRQLRDELLGDKDATTKTLTQICELANSLCRTPVVIRYSLRPQLSWNHFLPQAHWLQVADTARFDPGEATRHSLVRRYMYMRITAGTDHSAPISWRMTGQSDRTSLLTTFKQSITSDVLDALDDYASAFLYLHGINEPAVWSPPRSQKRKAMSTGRELDDIDLRLLHDLVWKPGRKPSLKEQAAMLKRSTRHVQLALDEWPPRHRGARHQDWYPLVLSAWQALGPAEQGAFRRQFGPPPPLDRSLATTLRSGPTAASNSDPAP